jgi:dethiobiotin synthetase
MKRFLITGTGTEIGKTTFTVALAHALVARGHRVTAVKPIETGCSPQPLDALRLAEASSAPGDEPRISHLAHHPDFYRAQPPLAPYAVERSTSPSPPLHLETLERALHEVSRETDFLLVEGAGGVLVPLTATITFADWCATLKAPIILLARNALGTLSHTLTAYESLTRRHVAVTCIVLSSHQQADRSTHSTLDPSVHSNRAILQTYLPATPILDFPTLHRGDREESIRAIDACGVLPLVTRGPDSRAAPT